MSIDPAFYRLYEACEQTGWKGSPADLVAAIRKLDHGMPAQDEFCLLVSWLGRCKLIHGLGQQQYPPTSFKNYRVPDFFAVFESAAGPIPVLIEVKSTSKNKLSWRPDYYEALTRYGEMLGLPVLLAWKETRARIWTLVDISRFAKARQNYNLTFSAAMKNSLLSMLAGDFLIEFTPGFGLHLHFRKLAPIEGDRVHCEVEEAYFLGPAGQRFTTLKGGLWPFFMTLDVDSNLEETATHLHQSFVVRKGCGSQFAHRGFPALFPEQKGKSWRGRLEEHSLRIRPEDLQDAAREASEYLATSGLMRIVPQNIPPYMQKVKKATIEELRARRITQ
jgi:Holliday junction resolvase